MLERAACPCTGQHGRQWYAFWFSTDIGFHSTLGCYSLIQNQGVSLFLPWAQLERVCKMWKPKRTCPNCLFYFLTGHRNYIFTSRGLVFLFNQSIMTPAPLWWVVTSQLSSKGAADLLFMCCVPFISSWIVFSTLTSILNYFYSYLLVAQSCPTLCNPMDYSLLGSSVHGVIQARILEWVAIFFSRGSSWPRDWTRVSYIAGRFFPTWAIWEAPLFYPLLNHFHS